jgi:hypothetical protein
MTSGLYSSVNRRIKKHRQVHSALIIRKPHLKYVARFESCCEEHDYAIVVPMSTHVVNGKVCGDAISAVTAEGKPTRLSFCMPMSEFLNLDVIDIKRLQ